MKNESSEKQPQRVRLIVPIIIYFLCFGIHVCASYILARFYPIRIIGEVSLALQPLHPVIMVLAYFLSYLYTKNRKYSYWGFALLMASPAIITYLEVGNLAVALLSITMILNNVLFAVLLYISYDWFRKVRKQKELEKQNLQSELKLLKNQLNPHFLFNTLNNIDSLIRSNPKRASESLVQMSQMMRYMIYETNVTEVNLCQELTYIENYLELQSLQYDNPDLVSYSVDGTAEDIHIAPMLFIPFIENTFKHCTNKKEKNAIRFHFDISKTEIRFEAFNLADMAKHINKDSSSGIGLNIVKRRLDFLYPGKHSLQIKQENGYFCVSLKITLI